MSTLKVNKIENTATSNGGIEIDNTGHVKIDTLQLPTDGQLSNRNLIINGAMQVAQRGTEETGFTASGYQTCDRFQLNIGSLGTWTVQQSTVSPDGYSNSFRVLCTAADASPAASDNFTIDYRVEAQDLQQIFTDKSAGDTHPLVLSFWVRSTKTGNASIDIRQSDNSDRQFTASYNIAAANTWEHKVIEIPADNDAVINNDNGVGLQILWWLNSGSNFTGGSHAAGWEASTIANRNATNLGVGGAVNDDFFITGVQLEVGEMATPFEHRSYGDELRLCQRYYEQIKQNGSQFQTLGQGSVLGTKFYTTLWYRTEKRAVPSVAVSSGAKFEVGLPSSKTNVSADEFYQPGVSACRMRIELVSGTTNGQAGQCAFDGNECSNASINIDAEL